jgi:hypothetical protein
MQLDAHTAEIAVSGAPICGDTGTQQVAYHDAALATLKAGYDGFIILGTGEGSDLAYIGSTPAVANTTYSPSGSTTVVSRGATFPLFRHKDQIVVRMFHTNDPGYQQAISGRRVLGPNWQEKLANGMPHTC